MNSIVVVSTVADGNMLLATDQSNAAVINNRTVWLAKHAISLAHTTRVRIVYEGNDYRRYHQVSSSEKGDGMSNEKVVIADALVTRDTNHALFLPIADCIGAVIFDATKPVLMLSHLGRHSIEQNGGYESIKFLINSYDCDPADLTVHLTPAAENDTYPLFAFNNRSLKDVAISQLLSAGVLPAHITNDSTDTANSSNYFSHSDFLLGNRPIDGRHAVVAYITN